MLIHQAADSVLDTLENLHSNFEEERLFRKWCLDFVRTQPLFADRHNHAGHLTASAWVLNETRDQVLLIHHRSLDKWFQPGGHIEPGDADLQAAAQRELEEECGITGAIPIQAGLFDLDIHLIPAKGDIPEHPHLDLRYVFQVPATAVEKPNLSEIRALRWFSLSELMSMPLQQSVRRMVLKSR